MKLLRSRGTKDYMKEILIRTVEEKRKTSQRLIVFCRNAEEIREVEALLKTVLSVIKYEENVIDSYFLDQCLLFGRSRFIHPEPKIRPLCKEFNLYGYYFLSQVSIIFIFYDYLH